MNRISKHTTSSAWSSFKIDIDKAVAARDRMASRLGCPKLWVDVGQRLVEVSTNNDKLYDWGVDIEAARDDLSALATAIHCVNRWDTTGKMCFAMARSGGDTTAKMSRRMSAADADAGAGDADADADADGDGVDLDALSALAPKVAEACGLPASTAAGDVYAAAAGAFNNPHVPPADGGDNPGAGDGTGDPAAMSLNVDLGPVYGNRTATVTFSSREVEILKQGRKERRRDERGYSFDFDLKQYGEMKARSALQSINEPDVVKFTRTLARKGVRILRTGGGS